MIPQEEEEEREREKRTHVVCGPPIDHFLSIVEVRPLIKYGGGHGLLIQESRCLGCQFLLVILVEVEAPATDVQAKDNDVETGRAQGMLQMRRCINQIMSPADLGGQSSMRSTLNELEFAGILTLW